MNRTTQEDMAVIRMGIDALLESVRQTETWWRLCGDGAALRRAQQFESAIHQTRRKFFPEDNSDVQVAEALIVADGLRDAARQGRAGRTTRAARRSCGDYRGAVSLARRAAVTRSPEFRRYLGGTRDASGDLSEQLSRPLSFAAIVGRNCADARAILARSMFAALRDRPRWFLHTQRRSIQRRFVLTASTGAR